MQRQLFPSMLKANGSKERKGFPLQWLLNPLSGLPALFSFSWEEKETGQNWKFCTASQNLGFCKEPALKRKRTCKVYRKEKCKLSLWQKKRMAALKRKRTVKAVPKRKRAEKSVLKRKRMAAQKPCQKIKEPVEAFLPRVILFKVN